MDFDSLENLTEEQLDKMFNDAAKDDKVMIISDCYRGYCVYYH